MLSPSRKALESKVEVKIMTADGEEKRVGNYRDGRNENVSDVKTLRIDQLEQIQIATGEKCVVGVG